MAKRTSKRPDSTGDLLTRVRKGDRLAADEMAARELAKLKRWAHGRIPRYARGTFDTQDLVQDAMLKTWRQINEIDVSKTGDLQSYTRKTARNKVIDLIRYETRRQTDDTMPDLPDSRYAPDREVERRQSQARLKAAEARLSETDRRLIDARFRREWSYELIAKRLHKPSPEAARVAIHRACKRLLAQLEEPAVPPARAPRRKSR